MSSTFQVHNAIEANETAFVEDWHVRVTWISFMTLWVFWALIWTIRSFFINQSSATTVPDPTSTSGDAETAHKKFGFIPTVHVGSVGNDFAARLERAHQLVKDILFSLLCLLSMNTFARASTRAVMILSWFVVAFAVVFFVLELVIDNRYARFAYAFILFGIYLAIGGLAYKQGFY